MTIRKEDRVAAAEQPTAGGIELKGAEAVNVGSSAAHEVRRLCPLTGQCDDRPRLAYVDTVDHLVGVGHRHRRRTGETNLRRRFDADRDAKAADTRVLFHDIDSARPERRTLGQSSFDAEDRKSTRLNSSHLGISYA